MSVCENILYREATRNDKAFVTIISGFGCSSSVGKYGGEQFVTLGTGCFSDHTIAHEFIHALGFWHEQNRPDRDQYVYIQQQFISWGNEHNFVKRRNSLTYGLPYDGLSIMHYQSSAFSINRNPTIISKVIQIYM